MATFKMVPPSPYGQWPAPAAAQVPAPSVAQQPYPFAALPPGADPYAYARWPYRPLTLARGLGISGGIMLLLGGCLIMVPGILFLIWWTDTGLLGMVDVAAFALCIAGAVAAFKRTQRVLALVAPTFLAFACGFTMIEFEEFGWMVMPFAFISLALMMMGFHEMRSDNRWPRTPSPSSAHMAMAAPVEAGDSPPAALAPPSPYGQWPHPMEGPAAWPQPFAPFSPFPHRPITTRRTLGIVGVVHLLVAGGFVMFFGIIGMFMWFDEWTLTAMFSMVYFSAFTAAIVSSVAVLVRGSRWMALVGPVLVLIASLISMFEFDIFTVFVVPIAVLGLVFIMVGLPELRPDRSRGWVMAVPPDEGPGPTLRPGQDDAGPPPRDEWGAQWPSR